MGPYALLALVAVIAILVLIPTRRLYLAGWRAGLLAAYFLLVTGLGVIAAELRGPARFLIPILVVAYIAPFVTARAGIARLTGGRGRPGRIAGAGAVVRTIDRPALAPPRTPPPGDEPDDRVDHAAPRQDADAAHEAGSARDAAG